MQHVYKISGMSCTGCKTNVKQALGLGSLDEINQITVNLKKSEATITMTSHIPIEKLQQTLMNRQHLLSQLLE